MTKEKRHYILYRFFDASENLLYVGMTKSFDNRLQAHGNSSCWFSMASKITLQHCDSLEDLTSKEIDAIKKELPKFNKKDSPIYEKPVKKYSPSNCHLFVVKHFKCVEKIDLEKIDFSREEIFKVLNLEEKPSHRLLNDLEREISKFLCKKFDLSKQNLDSLFEFIETAPKVSYAKSNYYHKALLEANLLDIEDGYLVLSKNYFRKAGDKMNIAQALKAHLRSNQDKFVTVDEWCGSTETGFYDDVKFDHDALDKEIDTFCAEFEKAGE